MKKQDIYTGDCRKTNRHGGAKQAILLGAFLSFFGFLWYVAPIGIYPDSGSYISLQAGREPMYPLFLLLFRLIFKEADTIVWLAASGQLESEKAMSLINTWPALRVSVFVQSMLAALACFYLTKTIAKIFKLNIYMTLLTAFCTLTAYVLTPVASSSHMVLNTAVLTEGLTFPFHMFFTACMLQGLFSETKKKQYYIAAFFLSLFLVLTRNQMLVTFAVWCVVIGFEILRSRRWKQLLWLCLAVVLFFAGRSGFNHIYNKTMHKGYVGADTGSYNMLTTFLYLSDKEDEALLANEEHKALFRTMHDQMEAEGMTLADAPEGILGKAYHYEEYYDAIGFGIQQPCMFGYAAQKGLPEGQQLNAVVDVAARINSALFPRLVGKYVSNYLATVASGLTRSVSASGIVMGIYSIFIYLLAIILMVYLFKKNRQSKAALFMAFALLMICANVFATALMIMCLSRYMIYNTALFYIAGLMCLCELYGYKKKRG